jgi:plastocyanin
MNQTNKGWASINIVKAIIHLPAYQSFLVLAVLAISVSSLLLLSFPTSHNALAQTQTQPQKHSQQQQQQQPNILGSNIYQTQTIVLGKNIKNLMIFIPNEGHEDPIAAAKKDLRVINQPYIPQNAIVNVGTTVAWFNADAGHHHSITLVDNSTNNTVYNSGRFDNFNASKPLTLNSTGIFAYSGPSYDKMWPNYKMNGTVTVVNQPSATTFNSTTAATSPSTSSAARAGAPNNNFDTVTTLLVPSKLLDKTILDLKSQGFTIDNQYPFKSLRGAGSQSGGDPQQVLLVLTSSEKNLNQVTSTLAQITAALPYK